MLLYSPSYLPSYRGAFLFPFGGFNLINVNQIFNLETPMFNYAFDSFYKATFKIIQNPGKHAGFPGFAEKWFNSKYLDERPYEN